MARSLVADKAVSTPTAVTTILNESWVKIIHNIAGAKKDLIFNYQEMLNDTNYQLDDLSRKIEKRFANIFRSFNELKNKIKNALVGSGYSIKNMSKTLSDYSILLIKGFSQNFDQVKKEIEAYSSQLVEGFEDQLKQGNNSLDDVDRRLRIHNPMRQLSLGYSIASVGGKVIKNIQQVNIGEEVNIRVSDGKISSEVKNINKNKR